MKSGIRLPDPPWARFFAEPRLVVIEAEGRVRLPPEALAALDLRPGDLLSLQKHAISIRLDLYREMLAALRGSLGGPEEARLAREFLERQKTQVGEDGSVEIPRELMVLEAGRTYVLEGVREGLGHALYLYSDECDV